MPNGRSGAAAQRRVRETRRAVLVRDVEDAPDALGRTGPVPIWLTFPAPAEAEIPAGATFTATSKTRLTVLFVAIDIPTDMDATFTLDDQTLFDVTDDQGLEGGLPLGSLDADTGHDIDRAELTGTNHASQAQNVRVVLIATPRA